MSVNSEIIKYLLSKMETFESLHYNLRPPHSEKCVAATCACHSVPINKNMNSEMKKMIVHSMKY